jgi:hypothetical protein
MNPTDLFFIVLAAVIAGGLLTAVSVAALVRYSRAEDAGEKTKGFPDMFLVVTSFAFIFYGMWRAGLFG